MRFSFVRWATVFVAVIFTTLTAQAVAQPACAEYCYEPIPVAGGKDDTPKKSANNNGGRSSNAGNGNTGSTSGRGGDVASEPGREEATSSLAKKLGVDEKATNKRGKERNKHKKAPRKESGSSRDSDAAAGALSGVKPPPAGDSRASNSSLGLLIALLALTLGAGVAIFIRRRREGHPALGSLLRLAAIGIVMLGLFLVGTGNAIASSRANVPKGFFGILPQESITDEDAERMARGGLESVRLPFSWGQIQKEQGGAYNWSLIDAQVAAASKFGLAVLPIMYETSPGYGSNHARMPIDNGSQRQGWSQFLKEAVKRYGPGGAFWNEYAGQFKPLPIRTWQIWNEPNFHFFAKPVSVPRYLQLLKVSRRALRSQDPKAKLMLGGLYGSPREIRGKSMKSFNFLDQLYRRGGKRFFDAIAIHAYTPNNRQLNLLMNAIEKTLARRKAKRTPIHITELGWGSDGRTVFGKGSPAGQAKQLTSGYRLLIRRQRKLNLRSVYWFSWKDLPETSVSCNFCYSTGLFKAGEGLTAKPAWNRLVKLAGGSW